MDKLFAPFTIVDWLALGVGVALGVVVVFALRARQVWAHRQAYGYDVFRADTLRRRFVGWAALAMLIGAGVVALFIIRWVQSNANSAAANPPAAAEIDPLVGMKLVIPRMGVETTIIPARIVGQDWDISQLTTEVAHLEGTAIPGQKGNAALAGHITIPGAGWGPFRELDTLQPGDEVVIRTASNTAISYKVSEKMVVAPNDVQVVLPKGDTRLTLMTCTGWDKTINLYTQRIVVVAQLAQ